MFVKYMAEPLVECVTQDILSEPTAEMWERFSLYASRVQHININQWWSHRFTGGLHPSNNFVRIFTSSRQSGMVMFPSLRSWEWCSSSLLPQSNNRKLLSIFWTDQIESYSINLGTSDKHTAAMASNPPSLPSSPAPFTNAVFLKQLTTSLPNLTSLQVFRGKMPVPELAGELISLPLLLSSCSKIHTLKFVDIKIISWLRWLPCLTSSG